jgi:hypothetical protein
MRQSQNDTGNDLDSSYLPNSFLFIYALYFNKYIYIYIYIYLDTVSF